MKKATKILTFPEKKFFCLIFTFQVNIFSIRLRQKLKVLYSCYFKGIEGGGELGRDRLRERELQIHYPSERSIQERTRLSLRMAGIQVVQCSFAAFLDTLLPGRWIRITGARIQASTPVNYHATKPTLISLLSRVLAF